MTVAMRQRAHELIEALPIKVTSTPRARIRLAEIQDVRGCRPFWAYPLF
jgi:hypothetical protein